MAEELAWVMLILIIWPIWGVSVPAAFVKVIVQPPPYAVTVKKPAVVQSTSIELVAVATAVPSAEIAIAGPGLATQVSPLLEGMYPLGASASAGVFTVLVAPFRVTELASVFERIMRSVLNSTWRGRRPARCT
jgi:hypothetical protein